EEQLAQYQKQVEQLKELTSLLQGPQEAVIARLKNANRQLFQRPRQALRTVHHLASMKEPDPSVLPPMLQRLFIGKDGSLLIMAYPKDNIWEPEPMRRFVEAMRRIDPNVTGAPIQIYESSILMRDSFMYIGVFSFFAVSLLVLLDFLSLRAILYVIFPLTLGVVWLMEIMGVFDVHLNMANFFAIPILIGIGVDNAVHFFHRYEENHDVEMSMYTTGTTLTLTTLTTITGFGSLIFASHKGLASLGALMAIGSATCWFSCVVFLPTLIKLTCRHHKAKKRSASR
ncbi:MAG: MMPL family transporter, partial [Candidatus Hinthialibacter sp.]